MNQFVDLTSPRSLVDHEHFVEREKEEKGGRKVRLAKTITFRVFTRGGEKKKEREGKRHDAGHVVAVRVSESLFLRRKKGGGREERGEASKLTISIELNPKGTGERGRGEKDDLWHETLSPSEPARPPSLQMEKRGREEKGKGGPLLTCQKKCSSLSRPR